MNVARRMAAAEPQQQVRLHARARPTPTFAPFFAAGAGATRPLFGEFCSPARNLCPEKTALYGDSEAVDMDEVALNWIVLSSPAYMDTMRPWGMLVAREEPLFSCVGIVGVVVVLGCNS